MHCHEQFQLRALSKRAMASTLSVLLVMAMLPLAGCTSHEQELQTWMDAERNQHPPKVQSIQAPQQFNPEPYGTSDAVDPFNEQKLVVVLNRQTTQLNPLCAAEMNRRKEPLEAFPLDGVKMVGSVSRKGTLFALLKVDSLLYQVKVGDYMGLNYGKIMKITETDITVREIVQELDGECMERATTLQLQEEAQ